MTWIWSGPIETKGRASRTESLRLVPSQFTERHQAAHVPEVWPVPRRSVIDRLVDFYEATIWPALFVIFAVIAAVAVAVVITL